MTRRTSCAFNAAVFCRTRSRRWIFLGVSDVSEISNLWCLTCAEYEQRARKLLVIYVNHFR